MVHLVYRSIAADMRNCTDKISKCCTEVTKSLKTRLMTTLQKHPLIINHCPRIETDISDMCPETTEKTPKHENIITNTGGEVGHIGMTEH